MQIVLNVKGSFRTTGSGHNREVVALYRWSPCFGGGGGGISTYLCIDSISHHLFDVSC